MILHLAGGDFAVKNFKTFNIIEIEYTFSDAFPPDFCFVFPVTNFVDFYTLSFILVNMSSFVITTDLVCTALLYFGFSFGTLPLPCNTSSMLFCFCIGLKQICGKKKTAWGENEHVLGKEVNKLWGETRTEHVHLSPHAISYFQVIGKIFN
ncbi:hypothetical protein Avbf_02460 [Armadillidium vulgare]|nr:hypothetical protein Avbf_02460 [Armadillidium vulgare]